MTIVELLSGVGTIIIIVVWMITVAKVFVYDFKIAKVTDEVYDPPTVASNLLHNKTTDNKRRKA